MSKKASGIRSPLDLELELTVVVRHQTRVLGTEFQSSTRAGSALHPGAISPAPGVKTSVWLRSFFGSPDPILSCSHRRAGILGIAMAPRSAPHQGYIEDENSLLSAWIPTFPASSEGGNEETSESGQASTTLSLEEVGLWGWGGQGRLRQEHSVRRPEGQAWSALAGTEGPEPHKTAPCLATLSLPLLPGPPSPCSIFTGP